MFQTVYKKWFWRAPIEMNTRIGIKAHVPRVNTEVLSYPSDPALPLFSDVIELYFPTCHTFYLISWVLWLFLSTNKIRMQRITPSQLDQLWTMGSLWQVKVLRPSLIWRDCFQLWDQNQNGIWGPPCHYTKARTPYPLSRSYRCKEKSRCWCWDQILF